MIIHPHYKLVVSTRFCYSDALEKVTGIFLISRLLLLDLAITLFEYGDY